MKNVLVQVEMTHQQIDLVTTCLERFSLLDARCLSNSAAEAEKLMEAFAVMQHEFNAQGFDGKPRPRF